MKHWRCSGVSIVKFEYTLHLGLVCLLLTLTKVSHLVVLRQKNIFQDNTIVYGFSNTCSFQITLFANIQVKLNILEVLAMLQKQSSGGVL